MTFAYIPKKAVEKLRGHLENMPNSEWNNGYENGKEETITRLLKEAVELPKAERQLNIDNNDFEAGFNAGRILYREGLIELLQGDVK